VKAREAVRADGIRPRVHLVGSEEDASGVARLLAECRADLDRVQPEQLAAELAAGALIVDTRPWEQRTRDGALPGAVVIDRNVLEWRLDPTSPYRMDGFDDPDRRVIIVCNQGFSSSLAAHTLRRLGLSRATDLVGGYQAWKSSSMPPVTPQETSEAST
jgi:rhodanese-related sulfurtransferase